MRARPTPSPCAAYVLLVNQKQTCEPLRKNIFSASDEVLGRKISMVKGSESDEKGEAQCQTGSVSDRIVFSCMPQKT